MVNLFFLKKILKSTIILRKLLMFFFKHYLFLVSFQQKKTRSRISIKFNENHKC